MTDDTFQLSSYSQLCIDARLYDESLMYEDAQMGEANLPYDNWFSFDINGHAAMVDASKLCDPQPVSLSGGSEGGSEASSPASPTSTDSFYTHQTSRDPSLSYFPPYASASTPASSAYSSPDATTGQEAASPSESPT